MAGTLFEDNRSPYLTVVEQASAPSAPATSGDRHLHAGTDHVLYWRDSAGTTSPLVALNKWDATAAPTTAADNTAGYGVGSRWIDTTNAKEYVCLDASTGAAVWTETTQTGGGSGISSGTSNPGSPSAGDLFNRTDLNMIIEYDGTRWLSPQHSMGPGYSAGIPLTANGDARFPVDTTYGIWMDYLAATTFAGGLSGSAYWTATLRWANAAGTETSLGNFNSSADTSANWTPHKITLGSVLDSTARGMRVTLDKTGAPGNLYVGLQLLYRYIIT